MKAMYVLGVTFQALTDGCVNPDKDVMAVRPRPAQKIVASITSRCSEKEPAPLPQKGRNEDRIRQRGGNRGLKKSAPDLKHLNSL